MQPTEDQPSPSDVPYHTQHLSNVAAAVRELKHPTQIGPYAIREVVGEGGMGTVYKAEQVRPIRRIVALKLIKLGMDTRDVIARFESERQALAMMNHPHVARVLDAGATETGRPYFVMEFVAGEPITAFADRHKLTVRRRLILFTQACEAVQHAHQKAIIHRDLKPSNILVSYEAEQASVKVIDFGVAKATGGRLTEKTLFTQTGQLMGTPEYMAPEQADALDVDTRTDVYALGVVLYELISGSLPFDPATLRSAGYQEIQRIIRDVDPPRPSTRLSGLGAAAGEVARLRQTPLESLSHELRSELEWIPLKAMRKERDGRYASAAELADDIHNYLANRPLRAGPESRAYRTKKFLRRNWRGASAAAAMAALLLAGIVTTGWQAIRATRAEREALAASENLREVNRFLTEDLLASAAPDVSRGEELTVREAVDRAAQHVAERFRDRPLNEAAVRVVLAETYHALGVSEAGLPHAQAALELLRKQHGDDHRATLSAMHTVGRLLIGVNRYSEAETLLTGALGRAQRVLGETDEVTLHSLGDLAVAIRRQRRFGEAEPLYRRTLELVMQVYGPRSKEAGLLLNGMATLLGEQDRDAESETYLRRALEVMKLHGGDGTAYLTAVANHGKLLQRLGRIEDAEAAARQALAGRRRILKDDHPQTLLSINDLAWILAEQGKFEEANSLAAESLEGRRQVLGAEDRDTLQSMNAFGRILTMQRRYDEAEQMLRAAVEGRKRVLGESHAHTLGSTAHLATVYELQHRYADAEPLLAHVSRPEFAEVLGEVQRKSVLARWGLCLAQLHRYAEAEPILSNSLKALTDSPDDSPLAGRVAAGLVLVYDRLGRSGDAQALREQLASNSPATAPAP